MKTVMILLMFITIFCFSAYGQHPNKQPLPISFLQGTDTLEIGKNLNNHDPVLMVWSNDAVPTSVEVMFGTGSSVAAHVAKALVRPGESTYTVHVRNFCKEFSKEPRKGRFVIVANKIRTPEKTVPFQSWTFPCPIPGR